MSMATDEPGPGSLGFVFASEMSTVVQFSPFRPHKPGGKNRLARCDLGGLVCERLACLEVPVTRYPMCKLVNGIEGLGTPKAKQTWLTLLHLWGRSW